MRVRVRDEDGDGAGGGSIVDNNVVHTLIEGDDIIDLGLLVGHRLNSEITSLCENHTG